jgi:hypothetical protein
MKTNKFQGFKIDAKGWITGVPYLLNTKEEDPEDCVNKACIITGADWDGTCGFMSPDNRCFVEVFPDSIGQYVNFNDIHNIELFEKDIISYEKLSTMGDRYITYTMVLPQLTDYLTYYELTTLAKNITKIGNEITTPELIKDTINYKLGKRY